ncbi:MAG: hypothetical protein AAB706_00145 [Patescibacteria group bacterium]
MSKKGEIVFLTLFLGLFLTAGSFRAVFAEDVMPMGENQGVAQEMAMAESDTGTDVRTIQLANGVNLIGSDEISEQPGINLTKIQVPDSLQVTKDELGEMRYHFKDQSGSEVLDLDLSQPVEAKDGKTYVIKADLNSLKWENLEGKPIFLVSS